MPYNIANICNDFRKALVNDDSMSEIIAKSKTEFPIRRDLVSVGREFRNEFDYVLTARTVENNKHLFDYIFNMTQLRRNEQRISQSRSFGSLLSNLKEFKENKDVEFSEIDANFIFDYAEWLKHTGIIESTQSFYLRTLRTILNKAAEDGLIKVSPGWFRKVNTKIYYSTDAVDKSISRDLLLKIETANLSAYKPQVLVRDMFMFGFYCGGMELVDVANLTIANVKNGLLRYHRRLKGQERVVTLGEHAKNIIKRYNREGQHYLFPLLEESGDLMFGTIRNYVDQSMRAIGKQIGYPKLSFSLNIDTYKALVAGVSISEMLLTHGDVG